MYRSPRFKTLNRKEKIEIINTRINEFKLELVACNDMREFHTKTNKIRTWLLRNLKKLDEA